MKWTNLKKENIYHKNLHKMQTNREGLKLLSPSSSSSSSSSSSHTLGSLSLSLSLGCDGKQGPGRGWVIRLKTRFTLCDQHDFDKTQLILTISSRVLDENREERP
jgi:hypothetical protein